MKDYWQEQCTGDKREFVKGVWNQTCENARTETIAGTVTQNFGSEHNLTVAKLAIHTFNKGKVDRVTGDWTIHVTGKRSETIEGDRKYVYKSDWLTVTEGRSNDLFVGEKVSVNYGLTVSSNIIGKYERNIGVSVSVTDGLRATRDAFKVDRSNIRTQKIDVNLDDETTQVTKSQARIASIGMFIIK